MSYLPLGYGGLAPQHGTLLAGLGFAAAQGAPPVSVVQVPGGPDGTRATLKIMERLAQRAQADPDFVLFAKQIVGRAGVRAKDYLGELTALFDWVKANVVYRQDPRWFEWVQYPTYTLAHRGEGADCDDSSVLTAGLALALGHAAAFRAIQADPRRPGEFTHVYALAGFPSRGGDGLPAGQTVWYALDTTQAESYPGWEPGREIGVSYPHEDLVIARG